MLHDSNAESLYIEALRKFCIERSPNNTRLHTRPVIDTEESVVPLIPEHHTNCMHHLKIFFLSAVKEHCRQLT